MKTYKILRLKAHEVDPRIILAGILYIFFHRAVAEDVKILIHAPVVDQEIYSLDLIETAYEYIRSVSFFRLFRECDVFEIRLCKLLVQMVSQKLSEFAPVEIRQEDVSKFLISSEHPVDPKHIDQYQSLDL